MATNNGLARNNAGLAGTALLTGEVIPEMSVGTQSTVGALPTNTTTSMVQVPAANIPRYQEWLAQQNNPTSDTLAGGNNWVRDTSSLGRLGLGLAGFLENRKTANLQRQALRDDIATAREHRANRQALGASWNNAWSS